MSTTSIAGALGNDAHSIADVLREKIVAAGGNPGNSFAIADLVKKLPKSGGNTIIKTVATSTFSQQDFMSMMNALVESHGGMENVLAEISKSEIAEVVSTDGMVRLWGVATVSMGNVHMYIPATVVSYFGDSAFERCEVAFGAAHQIGGLAAGIRQSKSNAPELFGGIFHMKGVTESPTILEDFTIIDSMAQEVQFTFFY